MGIEEILVKAGIDGLASWLKGRCGHLTKQQAEKMLSVAMQELLRPNGDADAAEAVLREIKARGYSHLRDFILAERMLKADDQFKDRPRRLIGFRPDENASESANKSETSQVRSVPIKEIAKKSGTHRPKEKNRRTSASHRTANPRRVRRR